MAKSRVRRPSRWLVALPWGLFGLVLGFAFGTGAAALMLSQGATPPPGLVPMVAVACGFGLYMLGALLIEGSGDLARRVFLGAELGTKPEYSVAQSLEIRGDYEGAIEAYRAGAAEYPEDPEPWIRGARILTRNLSRLDEAASWLTRARSIPDLDVRDQVRIDQQLVELYDGPLADPRRALPILARMAEVNAGTRPGEWAARRLARLRTRAWDAVRDDHVEEMTGYQRKVRGK